MFDIFDALSASHAIGDNLGLSEAQRLAMQMAMMDNSKKTEGNASAESDATLTRDETDDANNDDDDNEQFQCPTPLSKAAMRIAEQRPMGWEAKLLSQVMDDGISTYNTSPATLDYDSNWLTDSVEVMKIALQALPSLVQSELQAAMGEPGQPGNAAALAYVANQIVGIHSSLLNKSASNKAMCVTKENMRLVTAMSKALEGIACDIERFSDQLKRAVSVVPDEQIPDFPTTNIDLSLNINDANLTDIKDELSRIEGLM